RNGADGAGAAAQIALTAETLSQVWAQLVEQAPLALQVHLRRVSSLAIPGPNTLALRFATGYNHPYERCQEPAQLSTLQQLLRQLTGQSWKVRVEMGAAAPDAVASFAPAAGASEATPARVRKQQEEKALEAPLLKKAVDLLGAQVVRMDDGFGSDPAP